LASAYLENSPIVTSDERHKSGIRTLNEKEVNIAESILGKVYKRLEAINQKGEQEARLHVGVSAQQVVEAFEYTGLDPYLYSLNVKNEWYEYEHIIPATEGQPAIEAVPAIEEKEAVLDEDGNILEPAIRARFGIPEQPAIEATPERRELRTAKTLADIPAEYRDVAIHREKLGIRYTELYALLFSAIKVHLGQHRDEIAQLKDEITQLKAQIAQS